MAIVDAARNAWWTARSGRESEARTALGKMLSPFDVSLLETVDVQVADTYTLFVFRDHEDGVHLAARSQGTGWVVHVVADQGGWTTLGDPVKSLAHLHEILPKPEPVDTVPAPVVWTQGVAYKVGDRVTHNGATWEAVTGDKTGAVYTEPGVYGWQQVTG